MMLDLSGYTLYKNFDEKLSLDAGTYILITSSIDIGIVVSGIPLNNLIPAVKITLPETTQLMIEDSTKPVAKVYVWKESQ